MKAEYGQLIAEEERRFGSTKIEMLRAQKKSEFEIAKRLLEKGLVPYSDRLKEELALGSLLKKMEERLTANEKARLVEQFLDEIEQSQKITRIKAPKSMKLSRKTLESESEKIHITLSKGRIQTSIADILRKRAERRLPELTAMLFEQKNGS